MNETALLELLKDLPKRTFQHEQEFQLDILSEFVTNLGYNPEHLIYQPSYRTQDTVLMPDAVVSKSKLKSPHLVVEARMKVFGAKNEELEERLSLYKDVSGAKYGVLISPDELWIVNSEHEFYKFALRELGAEEFNQIRNLLKPPEKLPDRDLSIPAKESDKVIENEHFELKLDSYISKLNRVKDAETNQEKKESLERLAELLFDRIDCLEVRERNHNTGSSEIDLIVEHNRNCDDSIFDEYGRFFLVECKNWKEPVGAKQIRDFKQKMSNRHVNLGFIFSKNGISGAKKGKNAKLEINSEFKTNKTAILVFDVKDLEDISAGSGLYKMIDQKLFNLRFSS
jgi:hypothetical protein